MPNLTIGLTDELEKKMNAFSDVNWSAVGRECIEQYIKQRSVGSLENAIEAVRGKRGEDFKGGYELVVANAGTISIAALEELSILRDNTGERLLGLIDKALAQRILTWKEEDEGRLAAVITEVHFVVSCDFVKGMQEAAKKLLEGSK